MKTKLLLWLMSTRAYNFLLKYVIPEITIFHATGPKWSVKQNIIKHMRAGDVLLSKSAFHLTNILIGGSYSHASIVVGKNKIAELVANGFNVVDVDKFCKGTTRVVLLRLNPDDEAYGKQMAEKAMTFAECDYDTSFTLNPEALYCSEIVYQSDFEKRMQCDLNDLVGMGREYISPDGLYQAPGLEVVFEWRDF